MVFSNLLYYFAVQSTFNMDKDKALASVNEIKELMEKSSKFVSFSGLTAIMAGIYSLAGSFIVAKVLSPGLTLQEITVTALVVLGASIVTAFVLSYYKAKKIEQKFFSKLTYRTLWSFALPLLVGGLLCLSLILNKSYGLTSSIMLLFYGLSLVNTSKYTYSNFAWLGYGFLLIGIVDCFFIGHGLLFWTIGFGGLHLLYGIWFYVHYERKSNR